MAGLRAELRAIYTALVRAIRPEPTDPQWTLHWQKAPLNYRIENFVEFCLCVHVSLAQRTFCDRFS